MIIILIQLNLQNKLKKLQSIELENKIWKMKLKESKDQMKLTKKKK